MDCPNCGETMRERDRSGVKIDFCPSCKGVWLDRGELDKIIAIELDDDGEVATPPRPAPTARRRDDDDDDDDDRRERRDRGYRDDDDYRSGDRKRSKKSSFFSNLTEMLGGEE